jgi:hypothetical protein
MSIFEERITKLERSTDANADEIQGLRTDLMDFMSDNGSLRYRIRDRTPRAEQTRRCADALQKIADILEADSAFAKTLKSANNAPPIPDYSPDAFGECRRTSPDPPQQYSIMVKWYDPEPTIALFSKIEHAQAFIGRTIGSSYSIQRVRVVR